jgi:hypothetical protein
MSEVLPPVPSSAISPASSRSTIPFFPSVIWVGTVGLLVAKVPKDFISTNPKNTEADYFFIQLAWWYQC